MSSTVGTVPFRDRDRSIASLGVVTGLAMEAALLSPDLHPRLTVHCAGPGPEAAAKAAWLLLEKGCDALASFGTAGGLDPALPSGGLVLATEVRFRDDTPPIPTDARARKALSESCRQMGLPVMEGPLLGSDAPVLGPADKAALFRDTGAVAVDMESHRLAEIAQDAGLPFLVVRAVADPATRAIPRWALKGVNGKGETRIGPILLALLLGPWRIPALTRLAKDSARASATLEAVGKTGLVG
jgi:adenosylhomocysteine nucleosidase